MKVMWDGTDLQISEGDEIEILRGIKYGGDYDYEIRATTIQNKTKGVRFRSRIEGTVMIKMPTDIDPPLKGYAKNVVIQTNTNFLLEEKAPPIVSNILRECEKFLDPKLYERCKDKDYHDVLMNAFPILEDRIRAKIGVDKKYSGQMLIDHALNPKKGKLILGEIPSEQESIYLLFKGAIGFLRNPTSHSLTEDESDIESFEIMCMVDLLLRFVKKAKLRS